MTCILQLTDSKVDGQTNNKKSIKYLSIIIAISLGVNLQKLVDLNLI